MNDSGPGTTNFSLSLFLSPSLAGTNDACKDDSEQHNIFQAILFKQLDVLAKFIDTSKSDYVLHLKAKDDLGRFVI